MPGDGLGLWEITSEPLVDNVYTFNAVLQDDADQISDPSEYFPLIIATDFGFFVDPITGAVTLKGKNGADDHVTLSLNNGDVVIDWLHPTLGLISQSFPVASS